MEASKLAPEDAPLTSKGERLSELRRRALKRIPARVVSDYLNMLLKFR